MTAGSIAAVVATRGAPAAAQTLPRWLPPALLALLVLPFDPWWIDAEAARRGILLLLAGGVALAWPRAGAGAPAGPERWLWLFLAWNGLAALGSAGQVVWPDVALRLGHFVALGLLLRLAARAPAAAWQRPAVGCLLAVAASGLLQRHGLGGFLGHGNTAEPVSVFGNRNVAAEFVAVAGAAAASLWPQARRLAAAALVLGGAYAIANGSRSALVALPIAVLFAAAWPGRARADRLGPVLALAAGLLLGLLAEQVRAAPAAEAQLAPADRVATVEVRLCIAERGLAMVGDAPLLGVGPGQFQVQYPRWRSQQEIELSSNGRREARAVGTAHDDWLEVAIEGGAPALLLLGAFAVALLRAAARRQDLAPLVALGLLMAVRSPLGNAPAVAAALLCAGGAATVPAASPSARGRRAVRLAGLLLAGLGLLTLLAQTLLARYLQARGPEPFAGPDRLEAALAPWPWDPSAWQLLAQERWHLLAQERPQGAQTLAKARQALAAADRAIALRPNEPSYKLLRADLLRWMGETKEARNELRAAAKLDPDDPRLQLQLAGIAFTEGDRDTVIEVLCTNPHPRLREGLADTFKEFERLATSADDAAAARRFYAEELFVRALDKIPAKDLRALRHAEELAKIARGAFRNAGLEGKDARLPVLTALLALDQGDAERADAEASAAVAAGPLLPWQRSFLAPHLDRLRALPSWARYLGP